MFKKTFRGSFFITKFYTFHYRPLVCSKLKGGGVLDEENANSIRCCLIYKHVLQRRTVIKLENEPHSSFSREYWNVVAGRQLKTKTRKGRNNKLTKINRIRLGDLWIFMVTTWRFVVSRGQIR